MSQFVVGVSGGIGSGKTTVTNAFAKLNVDIIDADVIARDVVAPGTKGLRAIVDKFGSQILDQGQCLNRRALREIIFSDEQAKSWLNELLHPLIRQETLRQTIDATSAYCMLSVPLLVENGSYKNVDRVLIVDVPESIQLTRSMARDKAEEALIKSIMASQASRQQRLEVADDVIDNSGNESELTKQVLALHQRYLQCANAVAQS
ncbi:MAG: dephospho-CoA kinase [Alteromonadaceae bacterium]|uniref:dephospho-CoA kinase n=1 Tax=Paraglaciecola chathamensis TaxID=368405 RepID=UPI000C4021BB|nr:dephospho-CoA kinase [Paraglaciecola agarilytica]MBN25848.1 dephospho-CoA kinase [Alteromonadaceae bacterium]|tara:strand:+ start:25439 stop:26053 length:615 start_codon:yes stop_codon:yes gene_type:complete